MTDLTFFMELSLDDLRVFARCPLEWFWEKRAGYPRPRTVASLRPEALRTALAFYYQAYAGSLSEAVGLVWRDWCEAWGDVTVANELAHYAQGRARVLGLFEKGLICPPGGGRYRAPRMTNAYRERIHRAGLTRLGHRLDDFARARGLILPSVESEYAGSLMGDVFADCLQAAEAVGRNAKLPLPDREVVLGWQVPYQVEVGHGLRLKGTADLLLQSPPESGEGAVIVEVHEYLPVLGLRPGLAARDLRVIAASLAQPCEPEQQGLTWQKVSQVVYRHWPTGETYEVCETNAGYLQAVLAAAVRGMSGQVIIPRALTGYEDCRECAYRELCWETGWDTLPLVDPGTLGLAEQVRDVTRLVRERIGNDGQAARRAMEGLELIQTALVRLLPDPIAAAAILAESRHQLETIQDGTP